MKTFITIWPGQLTSNIGSALTGFALGVARTIADLDGAKEIAQNHLEEALTYSRFQPFVK